eukprot:1727618-Amphidinium_carterae.1
MAFYPELSFVPSVWSQWQPHPKSCGERGFDSECFPPPHIMFNVINTSSKMDCTGQGVSFPVDGILLLTLGTCGLWCSHGGFP